MRGDAKSNGVHTKRLARLGAAFSAHRRETGGMPIAEELRRQAVSAVAAGVPAGTVCRVCHISWTQLSRWRQASTIATEPASGEARVLSVVESAESNRDEVDREEVEIRLGGFRLRIGRGVKGVQICLV